MGGGPLFAELMNAPLFAQLRYVGPADTLWRLSGTESPRPVGPDRGRRRHRRPARRPVDPRLAPDPERAARKPGDRHGDRPGPSQARFSGPQLIFTQISGRTAGRGSVTGTGSVDFRRRTHGAQPVVPGEPGAAAQPRRHRRAGDRPAADPFRRPGRDDLGRPQAQQGALPARPGQRGGERAAAPGARPRGRSRGRHHGPGPPPVETGPQARRKRPPGHWAGHQQPLDHRPQYRRLCRCAALHRPRRPHPRRL